MSKFLKSFNPLVIAQRFRSNRRCYNWRDEGIQYPGFKYYPRHADFKDPPYTPSKLFRVQLVKVLKGVPHYERKILAEFKLDDKLNTVTVIKNIPENNERLWKVKHLVKIDPITYPDGFPTDTRGTYLRENGELRVRKSLGPHEERLQLTENFVKDPKKLDGDTLRRDSRMKWMSGWDTQF